VVAVGSEEETELKLIADTVGNGAADRGARPGVS
jgi:hypothetical protein